MPHIIEIHDLKDARLDPYVRLTESQLRNKQSKDKGIFIAESMKVISHALENHSKPLSFLMEDRQYRNLPEGFLDTLPDIPVFVGKRELLSSLTGYALTRGILCAMERPEPNDPAAILATAKRVAVLEGIIDPTNVGAILRSAAALGMDAVLLSPTCCDPLHRRAVRVSMGTVFQVPWAYLSEDSHLWPQNGLSLLKQHGFSTAALALTSDSISLSDPILKSEEKLALFLGTEGDGLLPETISGCDHTVLIPMTHGVDSLNVAAASAVAFWELNKDSLAK